MQFLSRICQEPRSAARLFSELPANERELWLTLLPAAARVVKEGHEPGPSALEEARRWALERLGRVITSPGVRAQL